jgi:signal transduction histidine kinase
MDKWIQADVTSRLSTRRGALTVGRRFYGPSAINEAFLMDASVFQLEAAEEKLFTVLQPDVAERIREQAERNAFAVAANAIREEEKARVARELHDELAQSLTALKMDTLWVRDNAAAAPEALAAKLADMLEVLDRTVVATRRIAADLRPMLLDDLGLVPAIEWLAGNFTQRCGVACKLSMDEELELQEPYATAVFRIIQESLANVAKHAGASEVAVAIDKVPRAVTLTVRDNGCGFSTTAPRKPQSLGLMGLRERAELLGGSVAIDSAPGQGTCVEAHIPLLQARGAK